MTPTAVLPAAPHSCLRQEDVGETRGQTTARCGGGLIWRVLMRGESYLNCPRAFLLASPVSVFDRRHGGRRKQWAWPSCRKGRLTALTGERRAILIMALICFLVLSSACPAVSSKITRHKSGPDLLKGRTKDVVIGSRGTIQLGRAAEVLIEDFEGFEGVWSINSIVVSGGTIYFGTSPNGGIYKYSLNQLKKIYPVESDAGELSQAKKDLSSEQPPNDVNVPQTNKSAVLLADKSKVREYLSNEHIFAMTTDVSGRLLAGISGKQCRLYRFEADKAEIIFEPNDAKGSPPCGSTKYIFAIATDDAGNIYLGTGPQGKVYMLDSFGKEAQLIYDSRDKNILSLAVGERGFVYAGSDTRGLVYKINPRTKKATVLYDSDQPEITAVLFTTEGNLHAAATSAKIVQTQTKFASQLPFAGRPEVEEPEEEEEEEEEKEGVGIGGGGFTLKIANTKKKADDDELSSKRATLRKLIKPAKASYVYRINEDGFVASIFRETAVFFCLAEEDKKLLVGTGSDAQLFAVDPASEQQAIIYKDEQASQITALTVARGDVYLGTANPAKLIKLGTGLAREGNYTSDLIDAEQPAKWGKLQIEADVPKGCKVLAASRSGNVKDINDPTFSDWTELVEVIEPVQLHCPLGRFCQYKLVLQSEDGNESPLIREVAVASSVPNLAPKVKSVSIDRIAQKEGLFKISYKTEDDNGDKLIYKIDFRKVGRTNWIELKDELEEGGFEWDSQTVEDGLYEVRVTASDERGNTTATKLTGSRISEPVVADNTGPVIAKHAIEQDDKTITLRLQVTDEFSVIGKLDYTIDSNAQWINAVPDDMVYDTTEENFTIVIEKLEAGEHIITVKISDDVGNTTYKTFEVNVDGQ